MPTININDGELVGRGPSGAWVSAMAKVAHKPERMEGGPIEEPVLPVLGKGEPNNSSLLEADPPPNDATATLCVA